MKKKLTSKKFYYALLTIVIVTFVITNSEWLNKPKQVESMSITQVSPRKILKENRFNIWQNKSVFVLNGSNFLPDAKLYVNNKEIETAFGDKGLITAVVPDNLYSSAGELTLQLKSIKYPSNNEQVSNMVKIPVIEIKKEVQDMDIGQTNPSTINVSKKFNIFNDQSSLSLDGQNFIKGCKIYANGIELDTTYGSDKLITAVVPDNIYSQKGEIKIQVKYIDLDQEIIHISNTVTILVK